MGDQTVSAIPSYVTTILGQAGAWLAAILMTRGVASAEMNDVIIGAVVAIGTLAWRLVSAHLKTKKLNAAIAAPSGQATP